MSKQKTVTSRTDTVEEFLNGLSRMTPDGLEIPDSRPVELPVGFERPETIQDMIRRLVLDPAARADLQATGVETFDEADDFDIDDDIPVHSPYEENFDPGGVIAREQEVRAGLVRPRTPEELKAAADRLEAFKQERAAAKAKAEEAKKGA